MCLLVSDQNITQWIHLSNFQTEDTIFSKKKREISDYSIIKEVYIYLWIAVKDFFFPSDGRRWSYYQKSYSWHTFLDQVRSRKSNHQTSLNARYERFRFYSCIRNHKSYGIVKGKKLINIWMEHDIFLPRGKVKLLLLFLQPVRNFTNKTQCS